MPLSRSPSLSLPRSLDTHLHTFFFWDLRLDDSGCVRLAGGQSTPSMLCTTACVWVYTVSVASLDQTSTTSFLMARPTVLQINRELSLLLGSWKVTLPIKPGNSHSVSLWVYECERTCTGTGCAYCGSAHYVMWTILSRDGCVLK